jgi:hypothetical protein
MKDASIFKEQVMKIDSFIRMGTMLFVLTLLAHTIYAGPIPDTGQRQSYTEINGEDSTYLINPQTFTKLDHSGNTLSSLAESWAMVRDDVTGLIWEVKKSDQTIQDKSRQFSWYDPSDITNGGYSGTNTDGTDTNDYIRTLNTHAYGGFTDWRLPNIHELATLLNMGKTNNGIQTQFFPNTMNGGYWTCTTYADASQKAWHISFVTGKNAYDDKSKSMYVRAVRNEMPDNALSRFVNNTDGTVTDTLTGLIWQQNDIQERMTWEEALTQFNTLSLAGHTGWRMPTREELRSIVDYSRITPSIYINEFPNTVSSNYWTSTAHPFQENYIWCIHFYNGNDNYQSKNNQYYSRAVIGGQDLSDSSKVHIISPAQGSIWEKETSMNIQWQHDDLGQGKVEISISRDGSLFELITKTNNSGQFTWDKITEPVSPNCMLRIKPDINPNEANIQSFFRIITTKMPVLEVSPTTKEVSPFAGSFFLSIINSGMSIMDWKAKTVETWIHIDENNAMGTNNYSLEIKYDDNAGDARTGYIEISAPDTMNSPQTIAINQQAGYPVIDVSPTSHTISAIDDSAIFTISNAGTKFLVWTAMPLQDSWLSYLGNPSGTDSGKITVSVERNYGLTREAKIYISAPGAASTSVTITQTAGFPMLKVYPESQEISAESGTIELQVSNIGAGNMSWNAKSLTDWLIINTGFSGNDKGIIRISSQANDSLERTGIIKVTTDDGQAIEVSIKQKPGQPVLMVSPEEYRVSGQAGSVSFTIANAGSGILEWSAVSNAEWLTIIKPSTGIQQGFIRVEYSQNISSQRFGLITVSSTALAHTQTRVSIYQDALEGYLPTDWEYNPKNFQYQCMLVAAVYNNKKQPMVHDNDILAAFINGECRGIANPQDSPFGKLYFLQIWSNTQNDAVSFQFFDADTGTIFSQINEKIVFGVNASFGSMYAPFEINITEVDINIPLNRGWNWVSMNVRAKDMRLNSLLESINGQCQIVVGQNGFSEYYGEKWYGTIEEIDPTQMYLIKMFNMQTLTYSGDPVYYDDIAIQLDNGWNWIGYLPFFEMDINIALKSLGSSADRIVGQEGFSEYSEAWWGGLTVLKPCMGYQIQISEPSVLVYPRLENATKRKANQRRYHHLSDQFGQYQYQACLTVQLKHNNQILKPTPQDRLIALSTSNEIRGIATPKQVLGKSLFFLQVWLQSHNEKIKFQYEPASGHSSLKSTESITLEAYDVRGGLETPLTLNVKQDYLKSVIEILQILSGGH